MNDTSRQLADVTIQQMETYLTSTAWFRDGDIRQVASVWHREDNPDAEVVLPLSPAVRDYEQRFKEALTVVAEFEGRPVVEIANDAVRLSANVITVRVIGADTKDGTIPISDGVLLFAKAKDLLYAAAMSIYAKKRQFIGGPPKEAKFYVDSLLLGQTEVGSYVVNVIAPLPQSEPTKMVGAAEVPVAEAVTLNLVKGLEAITRAAMEYEKSRSLRSFEPAIESGASANMCDALIGFSGSERNREFEIQISGAAGPMFEGETKVYRFDVDDVAAVQKASDYYKGDYTLKSRQIWGFVKKLDRPQGEEMGTITVEAVVEDQTRNVKIELAPEQYHQGVLAHDTKAIVACRGDIHIRNRRARLLNPDDFRIVEIKDLL